LAARLPPFPAKLTYVTPEILDSPPRAPRASPGPSSSQILPSRSPLRRVYSGPGSKPDYSTCFVSHGVFDQLTLHSLSPISPHDFPSPRTPSPTLGDGRVLSLSARSNFATISAQPSPRVISRVISSSLSSRRTSTLSSQSPASSSESPRSSSRTYAQTSQSPHSTPSTWSPDTSATPSPRTPAGFTMGPSRQGLTQQVLVGTPRLPGPMALRAHARSLSQLAADSKSIIMREMLLPHPVRARRLSQPAAESASTYLQLLPHPVPCPLLPRIKTPTPPSLEEC
jgi:hypothetical protein